MGKGSTKRQHFVPRFYLRYSAGNAGMLRANRRVDDHYFRMRPEGICSERLLYESRKGTGEDGDAFFQENRFEDELSEVEGRLSKGLDDLQECCERQDYVNERFEEGRLAVCDLVANLIARSPSFLASDRGHVAKIVEEFAREEKLTPGDWDLLGLIGLRGSLEPVADAAIMRFTLLSGDPKAPTSHIRDRLAGCV